MLRVADDEAGEVRDVERAVEAEFHVHGTERAVLRAEHVEAGGGDERSRAGGGSGQRNRVASEERGGRIALLQLSRKIRARDHAQPRAFRVVEHRGRPIRVVDAAGGPGQTETVDQMAAAEALQQVAVTIERHLPGVGRQRAPLGCDAAAPRVEAVGGRVDAAHDAEGRLELRAVEDAVGENHGAHRVRGHHAAVVRVGDVDAAEEFGARVGSAVAVGVVEHEQARLGRHDHPSLVERDAVERVEAAREHGAGVGTSVAIGVLQDQDLVRRAFAGDGVRERRHGDDPEPAAGVEAHLHWVTQLGELRLGREEVHRVAVGHDEFLLQVGGGADGAAGETIRCFLAGPEGWQGWLREVGEPRPVPGGDAVDRVLG